MAKVRVLYFALARELSGVGDEWLEVAGLTHVDALRAILQARHPRLARPLLGMRFAVNEEMAEGDQPLRDGDVVAVIPPVAGGSGPPRVALSHEPLSVQDVTRLVGHRSAGAVATFTGVVRDHHAGREVTGLTYSAYEPMALREMQRIVDELEAEHGGVRVAVHHRLGRLEVGDEAVVCAASAAHREEAFLAVRALIDRIKARVPIWKHEVGPDGAVWVGSEDLLP